MNKLRVGDTVQITVGKDKGKSGKIKSFVGTDKVIVEGLNIAKKSQKPNPQFGIVGGILEIEKPLNVSNVKLLVGGKPSRVRIELDKVSGKRVRVSKKTGAKID